MSDTHSVRSHPTAPLVDIVAVEWCRIQVTLRVRLPAGSSLDPASLRLERRQGRGPAMPPTHSVVEGGVVALRFNVMQGPGQMPLEPGSWVLAAGIPGQTHGLPVVVGDAGPLDRGGLDPRVLAAAFTINEDLYRVTPALDPATRSLALEVGVDPGAGDPLDARERPARPRRIANRVARRARARAMLAAVRLVRLVARRNGRRILFTSDSRSELGGNLKLVYDRMVERGVDRDHELLTLFKPGIVARRSLVDRLRLPWLLARVDTIVIDDYQPVIYRVDAPEVRVVQLWHAVGAFKTVGYSRVGKAGGPSPYGRAHKNYTHVTVSSSEDVPTYAEAFGIPETHVFPTGVPRTDRFFDAAYAEKAREEAFAEFPEARGRKTILFAPTFRGDGARSATYDVERLDYVALHALCVERDAVCIIRMHPFVREPLGIPLELEDRILDGQRSPLDVNDLLFAVDLLVTDYSSIVYEFSTLGRPMLFYAYDLDEYVAGRDFYEPYEEFVPGRIVRTFADLLDAIRRDDCQIEKVAAFAERHFEHRDGRSTDRVVDLILAG